MCATNNWGIANSCNFDGVRSSDQENRRYEAILGKKLINCELVSSLVTNLCRASKVIQMDFAMTPLARHFLWVRSCLFAGSPRLCASPSVSLTPLSPELGGVRFLLIGELALL